MSRQSKRAAFADRQRWARRFRRITVANIGLPGFIGVVTNISVKTADGGIYRSGPGALFVGGGR